jgi:arabinogalactan endo-1,4-beta-galactosidase
MLRAVRFAWPLLIALPLYGCSSSPAGHTDDGHSGAPGGATAGAAGVSTGTGGASAGVGGTSGGAGTAGTSGSSGSPTCGSAGSGLGGTAASAGAGGAGSGGSATGPSFFIGADITDQEPAPTAAQDNLLSQLKAHGFNFVRLRTFVDPKAADGYDKTNGYDDLAHTVTFGKRIKDAGLGLLVDFHYSDNWADPGKQCIPVAWQGYTTIDALATAVHDYTKDAIQKLSAGGARPDMVQIGNETTPGMLLHHCDAGGAPLTGAVAITGSTGNWINLGKLLNAGAAGVKEVDANILISLHIDRGNSFSASKYWIDNATQQKVPFDAFGESCYQTYQGDANSTANTVTGWTSTFSQLVTAYPKLRFFAAEYGPMQRQINDVLFNLPNQQGLGTFNWEPTTQGDWNAAQPSDAQGSGSHALFTRSGNTYTAQPDLALYDLMKAAYASRL